MSTAPTTINETTFTPAQQASVAAAEKTAAPGTTYNNITNTPAAAPAATAPGAGATGRYPSTTAATAPAATPVSAAENAYVTDTTPENPSTITSRVASEFGGEISSIKSYYDSLLAEQGTVNTDESGKTRATVAASGELGSDMGNAAQAAQDKTNMTALGNITAEEGNAEGTVEGQEASTVEGEVSAERTDAQTADQQKLTYAQGQQTDAQNKVSQIAGSYDLSTLPQATYDALYEASGFQTPDEFNAYYNAARTSALTGGKTIGDATTGVWQQQLDGTWKTVIPSSGTIGDPTSGVWKMQSDGTYKNIIPAQPKIGSIGAAGSYVYNPSTGSISTIGPSARKYVTSGGTLYSIDPGNNSATPLASSPSNGVGWASNKSGSDSEKAAIISYIESKGYDVNATIENLQKDPTAYYDALGAASQAGYYTNTNVGVTGDAAASSMQDAADNADNAANDMSDEAGSGSQ